MNSNSLDKTRTRVGRKFVLLFVFALVALTYVITPLAVFAACPGQDNKKVANPAGAGAGAGNAAAGNVAAVRRQERINRRASDPARNANPANPSNNPATTPAVSAASNISSTNLREIVVALKTSTLQFVDPTTSNAVAFSTLSVQQRFEIVASDTTTNTTQNISAKLLNKTVALIILPTNVQQQILFDNIASPCQSRTSFPINLSGSTTQQAQCLDKNSASVTVSGSGTPLTLIFPQSEVL